MSNVDLYSLQSEDIVNDNVALTQQIDNRKAVKQLRNRSRKHKTRFGICFDVDGVLARGTIPLEQAKVGMKKIVNEKGEFRYPVTFITNSLNRNADKANQIAGWFNIHVSAKQLIGAQGPLEVFTELHKKHVLVIGQGHIHDIVTDLGFKKYCTIEQVSEAYPLLDMVDHDNRRRVAKYGYEEKPLERVEAIVLLGEPKRWESSLQLIIDLLRSDGQPDKVPEAVPENHMPIVACNMDLQFMDRACMPRYGHGAYLLCLEALYKKVTGKEMKYTSLVGKPSEITFRYNEHCIAREAIRMGIEEPVERLYLVGDTPDVDIVGTNLYQRYINRLHEREQTSAEDTCKTSLMYDPELPESRNIPSEAKLLPQTVQTMESLLVCTGVYNPDVQQDEMGDEKNYHGHRDFPRISQLYIPARTLKDCNEAIDYILRKEGEIEE